MLYSATPLLATFARLAIHPPEESTWNQVRGGNSANWQCAGTTCGNYFLPHESPLWSREVPERQECEPGLQWRKGKNRTVNIRAEPCCQEMTYRSRRQSASFDFALWVDRKVSLSSNLPHCCPGRLCRKRAAFVYSRVLFYCSSP
jgi:hypothetical protein